MRASSKVSTLSLFGAHLLWPTLGVAAGLEPHHHWHPGPLRITVAMLAAGVISLAAVLTLAVFILRDAGQRGSSKIE